MTDKEKAVAKTFERVLVEMTPEQKEKTLVFVEGMAFLATLRDDPLSLSDENVS